MPVKTYVLLDSLKPSVPIYTRISEGQRQRIDKIPVFGINRRVAFTDANGEYKVHRYKANAQSPSQDEQIEKQKIDANAKWTTQERRDLEFRNNVLVTNKLAAQKYLESLPFMEGVPGTIDDQKYPLYKLMDKEKEVKEKNNDFRLRLKVGNMIDQLNLKEAQELLIRLNGSHFQTPDTIDECIELLIDYMNSTETEEDLENMLKKEITVDEKAIILIGNAINKGVLSFDPTTGQITKKKNGKANVVRTMQAQDIHEQQRLFAEFITTEAGAALYSDIEKELEKIK